MRLWMIFDFAGVLAEHQSPTAKAGMVEVAGADPDRFWGSFWAHRPAYDSGSVSGEQYWSFVAGDTGRRWNHGTIQELIRRDVASWLVPNPEVMALTEDLAMSESVELAVLSNAPAELADAVDELPWLNHFSQRLFSSRLGLIKPDVDCYTAALELAGTQPSHTLFIDDRVENVGGAQQAGIDAHLFIDPLTLRENAERWLDRRIEA